MVKQTYGKLKKTPPRLKHAGKVQATSRVAKKSPSAESESEKEETPTKVSAIKPLTRGSLTAARQEDENEAGRVAAAV